MLEWLTSIDFSRLLTITTTGTPTQGSVAEAGSRAFEGVSAVVIPPERSTGSDDQTAIKSTIVVDARSVRIIPEQADSQKSPDEVLVIDRAQLRSWRYNVNVWYPNTVELEYTASSVDGKETDSRETTAPSAPAIWVLRLTWDRGSVREIHSAITDLRKQSVERGPSSV